MPSCERGNHHYTVEVIGQVIRYAGTSADDAVSALLTVDTDDDEEGYVVAEHATAPISYCRRESDRLECAAILASVPV